MTEKELVGAMIAKNTLRARMRDIEAIDYILDNLDDPRMNFRLTNDNGISFDIRDVQLFMFQLKDRYDAEIEASKSVLEKSGIELDCEEN